MIEAPNIIKGSILAVIAFFCMALFGICTKIALQTASVIEVSFYAYLSGTAILAIGILPKGLQFLKSEHYPGLIGRAVFGLTASFLYSLSINYIPIVNGTLLFNTAPIFIPLLSIAVLNAKIEKKIWLAVALGFLGIIAIIKPTEAIFSQPGNLIGLASGLSLAIAYMLMKQLTATEPGERIIFYYLGIGTCLQIPFMGSTKELDVKSYGFAVLSGILLLIAQLLLVKAYKYATAAQVGIYQYASVVFVGLINWLLWNAVPNAWDLIGVLLVTIAGFIIIRSGNGNKS